MAVSIRERVRDEIGLPLSIGVARTKHLAKVASQVAKPDGLVVVEPAEERAFLDPLPVRLIWGVGQITEDLLHRAGIDTIGQLASTDSSILEHLLGETTGNKLASLSANIDPRQVEGPRRAKSVGAQSALGHRLPTPSLIRETLGYLADRVAARLRGAHQAGRTVTVRVRFARLQSVTRSVTVPAPISATLTLTEVATQLAHAALADHSHEHEITLLAISVSNLRNEDSLQLELPLDPCEEQAVRHPGSTTGSARWGADRSVDAIRKKFGRAAVGYAAVVLSDGHRVPEEFRELAEHSMSD
jgi:DNA polymerase-4